jgi:tRNA(Arg) A34 adenosine deaminase TadA
MTAPTPNHQRREAGARAVAGLVVLLGGPAGRMVTWAEEAPFKPESRWFDAAALMKRLAESWGDQPYGAVLVANGSVIGLGPSRVVQRGDPSAHAEREAIRDAQKKLGRTQLAGSVLYSTSRPCRQCETAAAQAGVARMIFGAELNDAGAPQH